jgi:electron-transferring-flavoprotein dehydrogenase
MASEREVMEVDVLFVGGGVASLSGAIHLSNLIKKHDERVAAGGQGQAIGEVMIGVLEKGAYVGAHACSGAVMNPVALKELIPDFIEKGAPLEAEVSGEEVLLLTKTGQIKSPLTPPPLDNHGHYVVSLARLTQWLGSQAEEAGINIFPEFAGVEVLFEGTKVVGIRTGDKGVDAAGQPKGNYEPGIDLMAKATVFGEGPRGSLTKQLVAKMGLANKNPQTYVVGVKEVWELPEGRFPAGKVIHTMGFPHSSKTYGGGFVYGMKNNQVTLGLLTGLDYADPFLDPHREFQRFKTHPSIAAILKGGKMVQYGAKTAPVGGYWSIPRLALDGAVIVGDSAGLFVSQKIKGLHVAMKSGMLAAEAIFQAMLAGDFSQAKLAAYERAVLGSYIGKELHRSEERRVGKECRRLCRSRWSPYH